MRCSGTVALSPELEIVLGMWVRGVRRIALRGLTGGEEDSRECVVLPYRGSRRELLLLFVVVVEEERNELGDDRSLLNALRRNPICTVALVCCDASLLWFDGRVKMDRGGCRDGSSEPCENVVLVELRSMAERKVGKIE